MKGLLRAVVVAMALSMVGGLSTPAASLVAAQADASEPVGMVSGPWRMMAWQFAFAPAFPEQGLEARDGSNWGILVADMTNTGVDAGLSVTEVSLGDGEVSGDVARSVAVSESLGFTGLGADGVLPVAENGIARVAVVLDIPEGVGYPAIGIGDEVVRVESVMTEALDLAGLPQAVTSMQLEVATVEAVPGAATLSLSMQSGEAREVSLPGIIAPPTDGCFGAESTQLVNDTTAGTVWLETVIGVDAPTVWVNDIANGTFTLLAFELVAAGAVDADGAGVYGAWLAPISDRLESEETGLWSNCRGTGGEFINPPTPTPAPSPTPVPTPSAEQVREQYTWVDTRELLTRPFQFEGERIAVSGEVFTLQVDQDGTFMQIWVDTPTGIEAVVVLFLGNQTPGLYEGMYVTVYGTGGGTFEGTNSFGGTISQPVILADIVDY